MLGTNKYQQETKRLVIEIMDNEAAKDELRWDKQKDSLLHFDNRKLDSIQTLGLVIDNRFKFDKHIGSRTQKATTAYQAMSRLQNTKRGMTAAATHNIYTGMGCATFT